MSSQESLKLTRRQELEIAAGASFSVLDSRLKAPELQTAPTPGTLVETPRNSYLYKEELRGGKLVVVGYRTSPKWKTNTGFRGVIRSSTESAIAGSSIPVLESPKAGDIPWWDEYSRANNGDQGDLYYMTAAGLFSSSHDNTFGSLLDGTRPRFVLPFTYKDNQAKQLVGIPYGSEDTTQPLKKSVDTMNRQLHFLKQHSPFARVALLGHSLGGREVYELALRHPDIVAAVFSFDGAIKGVGLPPIPSVVQENILKYFVGDVGKDLIALGADPRTPELVDIQILEFRRHGGFFGTWANLYDEIVNFRYAYSQSSDTKIAGQELALLSYMAPWAYWEGTQLSQAKTTCNTNEPTSCLTVPLDSPGSDESANFERVGVYVGTHGAPLRDRYVKDEFQFVLKNLFPLYKNTRFEQATHRYSASNRVILGETTEREVRQLRGSGKTEKRRDGSTIYFVESKLRAEKEDEIIVKDGIVVFEKLYIPQYGNPLNIPTPFKSRQFLSTIGFYEVLPSSLYKDGVLYVFGSVGTTFVGNPATGAYYEAHSFIPSENEDYVANYYENVRLFS